LTTKDTRSSCPPPTQLERLADPSTDPKAAATPRLLPLDGGGLAIVASALPAAGRWGADLASGMPPGSFWFLEVVMGVSHDF
jgi:hypothetical protein